MALESESGPIWLSLTSRVVTFTVSPDSIVITGSLPASHAKWTRSSGNSCVVAILAPLARPRTLRPGRGRRRRSLPSGARPVSGSSAEDAQVPHGGAHERRALLRRVHGPDLEPGVDRVGR